MKVFSGLGDGEPRGKLETLDRRAFLRGLTLTSAGLLIPRVVYSIGAPQILTVQDIKDMVATLIRANAPPHPDGYYYYFVGSNPSAVRVGSG